MIKMKNHKIIKLINLYKLKNKLQNKLIVIYNIYDQYLLNNSLISFSK